ncbi:MAG: carbon monoxide dehydrogenase subunit G [Rickettsiales bacterium]
MDMSGEYVIPAPREAVWEALNDPELLKQCIPGCEEVNKTSDTTFEAKVTAKVGPVRAKFSGKVTLSDIDPPNGYTISGEGTGGAAGFAKGGAKVSLSDDPGGTKLNYSVDATVGGKLAQIGSRLIDSTAKKMANDFFGKFAELVAAETPSGSSPAEATSKADEASSSSAPPEPEAVASETQQLTTESENKGLSPVIWISGLVIVVLALVFAIPAQG